MNTTIETKDPNTKQQVNKIKPQVNLRQEQIPTHISNKSSIFTKISKKPSRHTNNDTSQTKIKVKLHTTNSLTQPTPHYTTPKIKQHYSQTINNLHQKKKQKPKQSTKNTTNKNTNNPTPKKK